MAIIHESLTRQIGTTNTDFRLNSQARGVILVARITAKGAGAATLALTLQFFDEASQTYVALKDSTTAAPVAVAIAATAVAPTENWTLTVYPSFGVVSPTAGKNMFFSAACPSGLRLVETVATDTVTLSIGAKSLN